MPFAQKLILTFSPLVLCLVMIVISVISAVSGIFIMRRSIPHKKLKIHNDIAGPLFSTVGVIYAVLVGFIVVVTWQSFDRANLDTQREANCVMDLYTDAGSFPVPVKIELRSLIGKYTKAVVKEEWKTIAWGQASPVAGEALEKIWKFYAGYTPETITQEVFFRESIQKLNQLDEFRLMRIMDSRHGIHPILWMVLITGAAVTVAFSFFFGSENLGSQIAMTVLLTIVIVLILFTILELDYPFSGGISIRPDAFQYILNRG
ncbi:MAG: DUF4239 domain-containing protein [Candidatus Omnitrophica bacterium]|nr:DUF4239 domain-containing protein [Candidatus Omnitrophota bacterium]